MESADDDDVLGWVRAAFGGYAPLAAMVLAYAVDERRALFVQWSRARREYARMLPAEWRRRSLDIDVLQCPNYYVLFGNLIAFGSYFTPAAQSAACFAARKLLE